MDSIKSESVESLDHAWVSAKDRAREMRLAYTSWRANGRGVLMGTQHLGRHGSSNIWWNLKLQFLCEHCRFSNMTYDKQGYQISTEVVVSNIFGIFTPKIGERFPIWLAHIFSNGLVQPSTRKVDISHLGTPRHLEIHDKKHGTPLYNGLINGFFGAISPL